MAKAKKKDKKKRKKKRKKFKFVSLVTHQRDDGVVDEARRDLDDVAAAALLHLGDRELRHVEESREVDAEHEQLIWTHPGMSTYYRNKQGRVFSAMPWRFVDYWQMTHDPDLSQYRQTKV